MTTTKPMEIERLFRVDGVPGQDSCVMRIVIKPGRVMLLDGARYKGLAWRQAERYAAEILKASRAARTLAVLSEDRSRSHPDEFGPPSACTKCGKEIREGAVATATEGGRRHVIGSPECGR